LLRSFVEAYPGAPDDLREQLTILNTGKKK
jgi:hypothetical protein